jgi:hypothetical protein
MEEIDTVVNDVNFDPAAAAACEDVWGKGSGAAGLDGKTGSLLAASIIATIMVVGYLIA